MQYLGILPHDFNPADLWGLGSANSFTSYLQYMYGYGENEFSNWSSWPFWNEFPSDGGSDGEGTSDDGGGPAQPNFRLGNSYTQQQKDMVTSAFNDALNRLLEPKCASIFGADDPAEPMAVLAAAAFRLVDLGDPKRSTTRDSDWYIIGAQALSSAQEIRLNTNGPFFNQKIWVQAAGLFLQVDTGGLTQSSFGALLLLHELGHLMYVAGPDADNRARNTAWTSTVFDNCF